MLKKPMTTEELFDKIKGILQNIETGIKSSVFTKVLKQKLLHQCSGWHKL